ncbi:hypothetical protein BTUL_0245g00070 [Botrytis tulipae]|uniref:Uncharacterized protein n=1 Tax=Botrytis tulipae TaxID=87230 RepID=A0A4Z1E6P5_9HELO|nr:hypothetical protein BTUL_0245g00070 [Botrytis tulipae]
MSWYFVACFKEMEKPKPAYGGTKCFHTKIRIAKSQKGLLRLVKCVPEDDLRRKRTFIVKERSLGGLFMKTYRSEFLYLHPFTNDYTWFVQRWTNKTLTALNEATSELKRMLDKCIMDDSVYIFENHLQPRILNHRFSTFSNRFIENRQTLSEFPIEIEGVMITKTFPPRRTTYDVPSHQQSNINATKDIVSHKPKQVLKPHTATQALQRLDI